jgi:hypothetical protein
MRDTILCQHVMNTQLLNANTAITNKNTSWEISRMDKILP